MIQKIQHPRIWRSALSWIFYTRRPFRAEELRELLVIKEGDKDLFIAAYFPLLEDIQNVCRGLVACDTAIGVLRFSHFIIHTFLGGYNGLCPIYDLTKICLTYLSFDIFEGGPYETKVDLK